MTKIKCTHGFNVKCPSCGLKQEYNHTIEFCDKLKGPCNHKIQFYCNPDNEGCGYKQPYMKITRRCHKKKGE